MRLTRETVFGLALIGWAAATVPLSYWPGGSLGLLLDLYFKAFAIFWLLGNIVTTPGRLQWMCWALTLMSVPLALAGIENFFSGAYAPDSLHARILGYDAGLTQNPNDLALMLNLLLPLSAGLLGSVRSASARTVLVGAVVLDAVAIVLTFSRAGFLTLAASGAFFLGGFARRQRWKPVVLTVALGLVSLPFLPQGYIDRLATIADIESDPTGSAQERWKDTLAAAQFVLDNPILGAGAGMNILALNEVRGPEWKMVHNAYLEYAVDLGLPGLVLFVLLLASCFRTAGSVRKRCQASPAVRGLGEIAHGIQVSLAAFAVAAFFHPVGYQFYFFYLAGLAVAARAAYEESTGQSLFES
jgi:O-antigen ligase